MFVISIVHQLLAESDPVPAVYRMIHTSCAVAVDLSVFAGLCVLLPPAHVRCCDVVPLRTAAAVPLHNFCYSSCST